MHEHSPDRAHQERIEKERTEYKAIARRVLGNLFRDVLNDTELEERLAMSDAVRFVTQEQMSALAQANPQDAGADGLIKYEVHEHGVRRIPIVLHDASRAATLHTIVHEGVHLMSPPSVFVTNPSADPGEETFSDYVGGLRFERNRQTTKIDDMTAPFDLHAQMRFWEAITDWLTELALLEELNEEELEEIATSGYYERHWITYLVRKSSNPVALIRSIKQSCTTGFEDPLRWCLQEQLGTNDDQFYDGLMQICGRPVTDEKCVDDWILLVDQSFPASIQS